MPIGKAALRRAGDDLAIISYGAYVHVALRVAERLAADGIEASVLDLRSARAARSRRACSRVARHCHRVLIVHEDSRTGGIGESLAAIIQEEAFESLDAPVRDHRRARHAGAVLAAARGVLPAGRRRDRARRAAARGVLTVVSAVSYQSSILPPEGGSYAPSIGMVRQLRSAADPRSPSPESRAPSPEPRVPSPESRSDPESRVPSVCPRAPP